MDRIRVRRSRTADLPPTQVRVRRVRRSPASAPETVVADDWGPEFIEGLSLYRCFSYYMMFSYLYYVLDLATVPDQYYDQLCKRMKDNWDDLEHPHKEHACIGDMIAGSGFAIRDYPERVKGAAIFWLKHNRSDEYEKYLQLIANRKSLWQKRTRQRRRT